MGLLNLNVNMPGDVGIIPRRVQMLTTDNLATITTAAYLNSTNLQGQAINQTDIFDVIYNYNVSTRQGVYIELQPAIAAAVITLNEVPTVGNVTLPVVNNDLAVFDGTTGQLKDGGALGTAGVKAASDNSKATVASVSAATVSGNLLKAADVAGTVADQGLALKSVAKAAAAGGSATQAFTDAFCTTASVVVGNWVTQANAVEVLTIVPSNGGFTVLSSGDAGAGTFSYIITK
jgi:hypothetical protein